jgi:hypothetical protein
MSLIDLYLPDDQNWQEELRLWLTFAVVVVLSFFLSRYGHAVANLEANKFGLLGDMLIIGLAFLFLVALFLLAWVTGRSAVWLCCKMFLAAPLAMLQMQWNLINSKVSSLGVSLKCGITHATRTGVSLIICPKSLVNRSLREYPLAKTPSPSKHPYQLFPLSCTLLN